MDRPSSSKLECYAAQGGRLAMVHELAGADREELKDKQLLAVRTELRSYRLDDRFHETCVVEQMIG
jgi:hypothetical protein